MKYLLLITITLVNLSMVYAVTQQNKELRNKIEILREVKCVIELDDHSN